MSDNPKTLERITDTDSELSEKSYFPFIDESVDTPGGEQYLLDDGKIFIECPGATVYEPGTRKIIAGVHFFDDDNPATGYEIISH
ncbi:MAG: hypothetical protein NTV06_01170, partial [candidate division Zixibacteria bacterium]|nr:hypothetical protein [candidate division Zixibacteria bacterium]